MESSTNKKYYTQTPNELLEVLKSKATNASIKAVISVIARKTYGFHKKTDEISLTQFEKETKLSRPTIVTALWRLREVELIIQLSKGRSKYSSNEWEIDLTNWEEKLVKLSQLVKNSDIDTASQLVKSTLHTKERQNKFNNYLPISSSSKETNFGEKSQPLSKTQPKDKPQPEVVFRSLLKKVRVNLEAMISKYSDSELDKFNISRNTEAAVNGIIYYTRVYKAYCGKEHPFYKLPQLRDCMLGFLDGIWHAEQSNLDISIDELIFKVIDRWFATTSPEPSNLLLSHFAGKGSWIFCNSLSSVMADYGLYWKEDENVYS